MALFRLVIFFGKLDVVEQVILGNCLAGIGGLEMSQPFIGDGIALGQTSRSRSAIVESEFTVTGHGRIFVEVTREALTATIRLLFRDCVHH